MQPKVSVLILSASDNSGGAARATYRLHTSLSKLNIHSKMLVQDKVTNDNSVIGPSKHFSQNLARMRVAFDMLPLKLYQQSEKQFFSIEWLPENISQVVKKVNPDIINLHWVCSGFLRIETLKKFGKPIVWTLQDMWPITGGCHYNEGCQKFQANCGSCPQIESNKDLDLSRWIHTRKQKNWEDLDLTVVAPSRWMADCSKSSSLFRDRRTEVIPFGLDTEIFKPIDKKVARDLLKLPSAAKIILFGAISPTSDKRKGYHLLEAALEKLQFSSNNEETVLAIFGASKAPSVLNYKVFALGILKDDLTLALAYSAADVMVVPSLQESFGQTASESLSCGTPVVSFDATGLKDIVDHKNNGYLAKPYEEEDLAEGIRWVLNHLESSKIRHNAREKALTSFSENIQAESYLTLFDELISTNT